MGARAIAVGAHPRVRPLGIGQGAATADEVDALRRSVEAEGKLVLFNPRPVGPYRCPECHAALEAAGDR